MPSNCSSDTYDCSSDVKMEAVADEKEYQCLVRATDGHTKFETLVSHDPSDTPLAPS